MDLSHIILGPIVTEKAERLKAGGPRHVYTLRIAKDATKIDVKSALKTFYGVDALKVRIVKVQSKSRQTNTGTMEKRHASKKALVTLSKDSKALDLSAVEAQ